MRSLLENRNSLILAINAMVLRGLRGLRGGSDDRSGGIAAVGGGADGGPLAAEGGL